MRGKQFKLTAKEILPLAEGFGACIASDKILVEGLPVGFMYREAPNNEVDSGWRFLSGYESDAYMGDPDNHGVYDVNTLANYDPEIIPFLESPVGAAYEREHGTDRFVAVPFEPPK